MLIYNEKENTQFRATHVYMPENTAIYRNSEVLIHHLEMTHTQLKNKVNIII